MKRLWYGMLGVLLSTTLVMGQSVKELEKQRRQTLEQLEQTGQMLKETKQNEKATTNKLSLLNKDIQNRTKLINGIDQEIRALDVEMDSLTGEKMTLQEELETLKADYARLVQQTHYADMQKSPLLFVLSAEDFNQMMRRIRYLQEFAQYRKDQVKRIEQTQAMIDERNTLLQQHKDTKTEVLQTQQREKDKLARDKKKQNAMLSQLKKQEKDLLAKQKKQQARANELNRKIDQMIQQDVQRTASSLTKEEKLVAGGFAQNKGRLPWPTEKGFISGQFGVQPHPTLAHVTVNNKGIYIQTTAGANARAVYEGVVSGVFVSDGRNVVIVKHGNYRTVYSNLTTLFVKNGDKVNAKQAIGKIYTDPENDNKTELFFQLRKDTDILNPSLWLTH